MVFAFALVVFPLVKIAPVLVSKNGQPTMADASDAQSIYLLGKTYFRSMLIIFSSLIFLLWWNMNIRFKGFIVNFLGFRESEPMLNFAFLWVIASVFMGILDTLGMLPEVTGQITLARGGNVMLILLLIGLVLSFIEVWKGASKNSQKTKILNIVDDEAPSKRGDGKRVLQHLFDDEDLEG